MNRIQLMVALIIGSFIVDIWSLPFFISFGNSFPMTGSDLAGSSGGRIAVYFSPLFMMKVIALALLAAPLAQKRLQPIPGSRISVFRRLLGDGFDAVLCAYLCSAPLMIEWLLLEAVMTGDWAWRFERHQVETRDHAMLLFFVCQVMAALIYYRWVMTLRTGATLGRYLAGYYVPEQRMNGATRYFRYAAKDEWVPGQSDADTTHRDLSPDRLSAAPARWTGDRSDNLTGTGR